MTPRHLIEPGRLAGSALLRAQSDARLVDLTRAGNDRAFEAIVDRYRRPLLRYCSRILPDGRGEDALQQVFLNAYGALHREVPPASLKSWLFTIAHNVSLNLLRQRGSAHDQLDAHEPPAEGADDALERRERFREVLVAVAALPPTQRDALVLRELEGRGHDEIARELGVTGGAARQLISRARDGIRAAAASVVPVPLIMRLTDGAAPPPTAARLAELTAAGGGLTLTKVVATAAVGGALVGGAVKAPDVVRSDRAHGDSNVAEAADDTTKPADDAGAAADPALRSDDRPGDSRHRGRGRDDAADADDRSGRDGGDDGPGDDRSGSGDRSGPDDGGSSGSDDIRRESNSGPGGGGDDGSGGDRSGTDDGGGGGGGDHSGPGSGDTTTTTTVPDTSGSSGSGDGSGDLVAPTDDAPLTDDSSGPGPGSGSGRD